MTIKGILFDLDGTLIHTAPDLQTAANKLMAQVDRRSLDVKEIEAMIGDGVPKLVERCFAATGDVPDADALAGHTARYLEHYNPHAADLCKPFPGVMDALERLKGHYPMVVATNKPMAASTEILDQMGISPYLTGVVAGDTLPGIKKPDPRHLLAACELMNVSPADAVMIGDNGNDVNAAKAADIKVVLMSYGYTRTPVTELGADKVVEGFDALPDVFAEL